MRLTSKLAYSVLDVLKARISLSGPIPVADYMRTALTSQTNSSGYYMRKDVFGQKGDFTTSPEISQMFGELIGIWGLQTWLQVGGPPEIKIVELGPGRGTMINDMIRVFHKFGHLTQGNLSVHLVEVSPHLANLQYQTLCSPNGTNLSNKIENPDQKDQKSSQDSDHVRLDPMKESDGHYYEGKSVIGKFPVFWHRDISTLPRSFSFFVAHEFFDALPIHKFQRVDGKWREVLVDYEPSGNFRFVVANCPTPALDLCFSLWPEFSSDPRNHIEVSLASAVILEGLCKRLSSDGGMGLIVDYGHEGTKEDTFRAFSSHSLADPLTSPGTIDLTADVDFKFFNYICENQAMVLGPIEQSIFLQRIGIDLRLKKLLESNEDAKTRENLLTGHKMLTEEMGNRFKFFGLLPLALQPFNLKIHGFDI